MSRLVDYFTVVSYGSTLDPFAPPVFDVDGAAGAGEVASAAAAVGTTRSAPQQPQPDQLSDNSQSKTYKEETETQQRHHTPTSASRGTNITPSVSSPNSNSSVLGVPCVPSPSPSLSPNPPVDLSRFHPSSSQRPTPSPTSSANLSSSPPSISRHLRPYSPASESRGTQPAISPKLADDAAQASNQHAATDSDSTSATQLTDINPTPLPSPPMVPPDLNLVVSPVGASPAPAIHSHFATAAESRAHLTPTYKHQTITTPHESNKPTQITEAKQTPLLLLSFNERLYRSKVVDRFPAVDHRSVPFPPGIAMFAMPDDITLTIVPALPIFYFFACTGVNGVRLYGSCLRFAEPLPAHMAEQVWAEEIIVQENKRKSKQDGREHTSHTKKEDAHSARSHPSPSASASASTSASAAVSSHPTPTHSSEPDSTSLYSYCLLPPNRRPPIYASKCLCLLSTYPFLRQFRDFLTCFYRRSLTPSPIPLERVIANFMQEVPLPPIGQVKVQYLLGDMCITFARPPSNNPFGFRPFPVRFLFQLLDFAHVMLLFECLLAEKRILLVSHSLSSLTVVSETLLSLMYPFVWQHVLIPLLPKSLIDFLHAPFPFIIGMHASYIDTASLHGDILDDLVIVDLDRNHVDLPGPTTRRPPGLPHKEKKKLWAKLKVLKLWRAPDARSAYETKCLDNMDLAFTNAPCPNEVELVERGRLDVVQALLEKEVLKNQNCSPSLARRARLESVSSGGGGNGNVSGVGGGVRFSSGLHTMAHRTSGSTGSSRSGGGGGPIDPKRCKTNITSPSALEFGLKDADLPDSPSNQEMMQADPPSLFECTPEGDSVDYLISSAFFRVFVSILKDYRPFLIFPSASNPVPDPCFDIPGFIKSVEGNSSRGSSGVEPFLREMCKTQAFRKFVEERTFPITGKEQQERLTFFDESILSKRNRSKIIGKKFETPFLADRSNDLNKTFVAPSPDASDLPLGETYVYSLFPTLDLALFSKPRISSAPFLIIQQSRRHQLNTARIAQRDRSRGSLSSKKSHASRKPSGSRRSSVRSGLMSSPDQVVMTLWFVLFTSIIGENRDARALDTAFQLLINMRRNGLQPEEEIFPCLMFACGACGQPERAIDVLREMTNNGFQPDANTYAALLQVFTMDGDHRGAEALACLKSNPSSPVTGGSLVSSLKRELAARGTPNYAKWNPTIGGESSGVVPVELDAQTHYQHPFDPNDPSSPCASPQPLKLTEMKESERINMFQLQFQMLFPSLEIRTEEECPECGKQVLDHDIRNGWTSYSNDYTTLCPFCSERFVARFSVVSKSWLSHAASPRAHYSHAQAYSHGAQATSQADALSPDSRALVDATKTLTQARQAASQTQDDAQQTTQIHEETTDHHADNSIDAPLAMSPPIIVEYLSPRVLKKEVIHLLEVKPPRYFTTRAFRKSSPALFWNLIWHATNQCLPIDFIIRKVRRPVDPASPSHHADHGDGDGVRRSSSRFSSLPLDDFDRAILYTRHLGIGRSFGYGSGGSVSGTGAVGISLGSIMRVRQNDTNSHCAASASASASPHQLEFDDDDDTDEEPPSDEETHFHRPEPEHTHHTNVAKSNTSQPDESRPLSLSHTDQPSHTPPVPAPSTSQLHSYTPHAYEPSIKRANPNVNQDHAHAHDTAQLDENGSIQPTINSKEEITHD